MRPTEVGDTIPDDFALQNCETGEMVNVKEFGANAQGIWYFATAGWCPACRRTLNILFADVFPTYTEETIRPMIVVSEDDQAEPATLAFCRTYAAVIPTVQLTSMLTLTWVLPLKTYGILWS